MTSAAISIDRLASAFDATPPGHLFHYTDLEGVKGIFTSRTLWLSKFTATNDISEIKLAIEKIFGVEVASINTLNRQGKTRRTKFGTGKRKDTKRAIVTLKSGSIDIFTSVG